MEIYKDIYDTTVEVFELSAVRIVGILLAVLIAQRLSHNFITKIIRQTVRSHKYESKREEEQREETLVSVFDTAISVILWILGIILILSQLGFNIAALATGAGLVGIIIGFGAQSTIKDFLKGFFIILENQYRVGDIVTLNGFSGVVEALTIRITRLRDLDGYTHIIPNGDITVVTNMSFGFSNVNIDIGVSYDSNISKVEKVINKVGAELAEDEEWKTLFIEPITFLRVDAFADSAVMIKALGKVIPGKQWDIAGEFRRRIKKEFEKEKIVIPFQQIVIHQAKADK